jgi:hypothetical protein
MANKLLIIKLAPKSEKVELPTRLSGLAKTHRLIMIEKHKEIQFMMLCAQIRLDDFKKQRADHQRDERREKRCRNVTID